MFSIQRKRKNKEKIEEIKEVDVAEPETKKQKKQIVEADSVTVNKEKKEKKKKGKKSKDLEEQLLNANEEEENNNSTEHANNQEEEEEEESSFKIHSKSPGTPQMNPISSTSNTPTPKKNEPFRRIRPEDVDFIDTRLMNNSYDAKQGDEFGRKAAVQLGQTKGKGFRHAKTKMKRGYRSAGPIDSGVNSFKFHYDDDE
jgi:hypothetical protein